MSSSQIAALKFLLRIQLRRGLSKLNKKDRVRKSRKIIHAVMGRARFRSARSLLIYAALPEEVRTRELIQKSLALGKRVFVPSVNLKKKLMEIFEIHHGTKDLKKGAYGIWEPVRRKKERPKDLDLVIVPGLGFDKRGVRLGRGEGYFDRFLKKTKCAVKWGLAFREQIVPRIPKAPHDVVMDDVLTD